ncbi:MAG TPA: ABC transporter substrate-binding protein [Paraburkholderia sp.]|jgi:NitT/TauT family transport system substrate-binding protein|uniref:ABC transporter substrate-binding protein n=1 Tax=Paraburkholderia sp. TaxID=1926495 RepID=UPI002DF2FD93|nr:ABC transporter substrate-binding protein [Paraburkholderia sp.]
MPFRAQHPGRALLLCLALGAAAAGIGAPVWAQPGQAAPEAVPPIRLMMGGMSKIVYLPAVLAARLGYFRDEGLDVQVVSGPAGIDTSTELIAGAIEGAVGFYDHTLDLQSRGQDVLSVVVFQRALGLAELASTRAEGGRALARSGSMRDAKGRRLGVTGFGSSTWVVTRYLAAGAGVAPGDYTIVPLATDTRFIEAIEQGSIDAGMVEEPTATRLLSSGAAQMVADMRSVEGSQRWLGGPYAGACLYMRRGWVDAHPHETAQLVHALVRALRYLDTHSAQAIAATLPPELTGADRAGYVQALAAAQPAFSRDGQMPEGAPQTVLRVLIAAGSGVAARHIDLAKTYTNTFVTGAQSDAPKGAP